MAHPGGRPPIYGEAIIEKANEYLRSCDDYEDEFHKTRGIKSDSYERILKVKLPSIEGLALHLEVARDTIYQWEKDHGEFSDILEKLRSQQAEVLLNKGLSGEYNPKIAALILSKHGYIEKREEDITSGGEKLNGVIILPQKDGTE